MLHFASARPRLPIIIGMGFLLLVWILFAAWQRAEYLHQRQLLHSSLASQAQSLSTAVNGGVQSHRWFGPFVQQRLQETLTVLARSKNVLAIAIVVDGGAEDACYAGDLKMADLQLPDGEHMDADRLQLSSSFSMSSTPPIRHALGMGRSGSDIGQPGHVANLKSIVVLDRSATAEQIRREAINRWLIFTLGTLLLISVGAVWQFTVRLVRSEGRARVLETETRHLRELGQAAAGLAHETRNPLGLIRGWTQRLLERGLSAPDQQQQAEAVLEECDRVTARINQFLAFARQAELQVTQVNVAELVEELAALLQSDLDARHLRLHTDLAHAPVLIQADRDHLRQVLFNLLQNAIAVAPDDSRIDVVLHRSGRNAMRLEVSDAGPGVPDDIAESLFEPYVTRRPGGTGLGLSIVRRIAAAHDWQVGYNAGESGGAVFWVEGIRTT